MTPPQEVDDHQKDESESHEHQFWDRKETTHAAPGDQLADCNECGSPYPQLVHEASQQVVDQSGKGSGDSSIENHRHGSLWREDGEPSFHVRDDTHDQASADAKDHQSQERPTYEIGSQLHDSPPYTNG